jgi:hypothetical protein
MLLIFSASRGRTKMGRRLTVFAVSGRMQQAQVVDKRRFDVLNTIDSPLLSARSVIGFACSVDAVQDIVAIEVQLCSASPPVWLFSVDR